MKINYFTEPEQKSLFKYFLIIFLPLCVFELGHIWFLSTQYGALVHNGMHLHNALPLISFLTMLITGLGIWKLLYYRRDSKRGQAELHKVNTELEERVEKRTQELKESNKSLQQQVEQTRKAISEKESMRSLLLQSQKMEAMGSLAGGIAHDFNNLLTIILGYSELAALFIDDKEKASDAIKTSLKAGDQARQLVQQILTFSRKQSHDNAPVIVPPVVKETLKLIRSSLPATIEIKQNIPLENTTILGNQTHLHQLVMNLCTNAAHAMEHQGKGELTITLTSVRKDVAQEKLNVNQAIGLFVRDTGKGMDTETRDRIFEPYFTTKDQEKGTGLGLAVVHGIVQQWNGVIEVDSEPENGTEFRIYLPSIEPEVTEESRDKNQAIKSSGHVLFVDDEVSMTRLGKAMLEQMGYTVTACDDPQQALRDFTADPSRFNVVVTDYTMPGLTGKELLEAMREERPDLPTVLGTGYSMEELTDEIDRGLIDVFLDKPFSIDQLANAVSQAIEKRQGK